MSSGYSPWIWSPDYRRHYCYRTDENGDTQYLWTGVHEQAQSQTQEPVTQALSQPSTSTTPRTVDPANSTSQWSAPHTYQGNSGGSLTSYTHQPQVAQPSWNPLPVSVRESVGGDLPRRYIRTGQDGNEEEILDSNYRRVAHHHHPYFFKRGRVFKMLWTEPAGQDNPGKTRGSTHFSVVRFGETAYSEIRRFVVLQNKGTFSQCIPIQTYRRQGARKRGLVVEDHAIIYTGDKDDPPPELLDGEEITKQALRVIPIKGEQLDRESRINFGKPYAIEHNCKVMDIGLVDDNHIHLLVNYFMQAMEI